MRLKSRLGHFTRPIELVPEAVQNRTNFAWDGNDSSREEKASEWLEAVV
jgi:hypothetical protein